MTRHLMCDLIQETIFKGKGRRPQWNTTGQSVSPQIAGFLVREPDFSMHMSPNK